MPKKAENKAQIRKRIKDERDKLNFEEKQKLDKKIFDKLHKSKYWKGSNKILIYISFENEVDTKILIKKYIKDKTLVVPKSNPKNFSLTLYEIKSLMDLEKGSYGILEPKKGTLKINENEIGLAIIPGVAFDKQGQRIGYGKAYYDKLIKKLNCTKIGLAYNIQLVENIPSQSHDQPVDLIITEDKTIDCHS